MGTLQEQLAAQQEAAQALEARAAAGAAAEARVVELEGQLQQAVEARGAEERRVLELGEQVQELQVSRGCSAAAWPKVNGSSSARVNNALAPEWQCSGNRYWIAGPPGCYWDLGSRGTTGAFLGSCAACRVA